jgi:hypothetical protein
MLSFIVMSIADSCHIHTRIFSWIFERYLYIIVYWIFRNLCSVYPAGGSVAHSRSCTRSPVLGKGNQHLWGYIGHAQKSPNFVGTLCKYILCLLEVTLLHNIGPVLTGLLEKIQVGELELAIAVELMPSLLKPILEWYITNFTDFLFVPQKFCLLATDS